MEKTTAREKTEKRKPLPKSGPGSRGHANKGRKLGSSLRCGYEMIAK